MPQVFKVGSYCVLFQANEVNANEITIDDEWIQENKWDEIYQKEIV